MVFQARFPNQQAPFLTNKPPLEAPFYRLTKVLLNSPPKPIDFVPNRFRGKGAGGQKRNLGPPQYLCIG